MTYFVKSNKKQTKFSKNLIDMFLCCRGLPLISSASSCFWLVYKIAFVLFNICLVMITQWERSPNWSTTILTLIRSCSSLCLQIYFSLVLSYRIKIYMARWIIPSAFTNLPTDEVILITFNFYSEIQYIHFHFYPELQYIHFHFYPEVRSIHFHFYPGVNISTYPFLSWGTIYSLPFLSRGTIYSLSLLSRGTISSYSLLAWATRGTQFNC